MANVLIHILVHLVGGDFKNRPKEIDYTNRGLESDPTHHVPVVPTDTNYGTDGNGNEVLIMNTKNDERPTSFFAQPGILAGKYLICKELFKKIKIGLIITQLVTLLLIPLINILIIHF